MGFNYDTWGGSWGTAWANSWGQQGVTPPTPTPTPPGPVGLYYAWWQREWERIKQERAEKRKKVPKRKKKLLEELDDAILELRARAEEYTPTPEVRQEVKRLEAFTDIEALNADITAAMVRDQIRFVEELMREMDDEEAILLAIH